MFTQHTHATEQTAKIGGQKNRLSVSDSREEAFRSYAHGREGRKAKNKTITAGVG